MAARIGARLVTSGRSAVPNYPDLENIRLLAVVGAKSAFDRGSGVARSKISVIALGVSGREPV